MKTILVPTDFSRVASNAISYAIELAKKTDATIVLLHVFHPPVATPETALIMPTVGELRAECEQSISRLAKTLLKKHGDLSLSTVCKMGLAADEINLYASAEKVDLVVMGMQGAGYFAEKLIGSVTTSVIRKATCPVLVIDKKVKYKTIRKIVFACDYQETENRQVLEPLKRFAEIFNAHIYVLNVMREMEPVSTTGKIVKEYIMLEDSMSDVDHTFHYLDNEDVVDGINQFVKNQNMDLVVMIPRKHTILKNIFSEPATRKMAFHSNVPLLALH